MTDWFWVKDATTGHEYPTVAVRDGEQVLDKPATDRFGDPLPAKPHINLASITSADGKSVDDMTVAELVVYAGRNGIDLGAATLKDDIRAKITSPQEGDEANEATTTEANKEAN